MEVFLGFDIGTTSIKASAIDGEGRILVSAQVPCAMETPRPGFFEIDAESQWLGGFLKAVDSLGAAVVSRASALCVSSVCASFVPVDASGSPLRRAILYGIDTRAAKQFGDWNRGLGAERIAAMAGTGFTSHSVLPKILWLKEEEPEIYARTTYFVESSNYISSFLTGEYAWDRPSAAGGHMIDLRRGEYPRDFLDEVGIDSAKLARLRYPLDILGAVRPGASSICGIPAGIPVLVGACDVNAEAFACGAIDPGSLLLVYGSTLSTLYTLGEYKTLPGFLTGPSVIQGTYRLGGATSSGGRYMDWLKKILGGEPVSSSEEGSLSDNRLSDSQPTGILMLPFLDGARIPYQNPAARVLWQGMDSSTDASKLWKAGMEAMGCELHDILGKFSRVGPLPGFAHVTGGLASNRHFLQIVADVSGMPLLHFKNVNAAYGDALMALSTVFGMDVAREVLELRRQDPENASLLEPSTVEYEAYAEQRSRYRSLIRLCCMDNE